VAIKATVTGRGTGEVEMRKMVAWLGQRKTVACNIASCGVGII
jgi:hypothetical protein